MARSANRRAGRIRGQINVCAPAVKRVVNHRLADGIGQLRDGGGAGYFLIDVLADGFFDLESDKNDVVRRRIGPFDVIEPPQVPAGVKVMV